MTFEELSKSNLNETLSDMAKDIAGKLGVKLDDFANNSNTPAPNKAEIGNGLDLNEVRKIIFNKQNMLRLKNRLSSFDTEDSTIGKLEAKCNEKVNQMKESFKSVKGNLKQDQINSWHTTAKDLGNFLLTVYPKESSMAIAAGNENLGFAKFEKNDKRNNAEFLANYIEKMWEKSKSHKEAILLSIPSSRRGSKFKVVTAMSITEDNGAYFFAQVMACVIVGKEEEKQVNKITSDSLGKEYGFTASQVKKMFNVIFDKNLDEKIVSSRVITLSGKKLYEVNDWLNTLESNKNDEISVFKKFLSSIQVEKAQERIVAILDDSEKLKNTFKSWASEQTSLTTHEMKAIKKIYSKLNVPSNNNTDDKSKNPQDEDGLSNTQWQQTIFDVFTKISQSDNLFNDTKAQILVNISEYLVDCERRNTVAPENFLIMLCEAVFSSDTKKRESVISNIQTSFLKLNKSEKLKATMVNNLLGIQTQIKGEMRSFSKAAGGNRIIISHFIKYIKSLNDKKELMPDYLLDVFKDFVQSSSEIENLWKNK